MSAVRPSEKRRSGLWREVRSSKRGWRRYIWIGPDDEGVELRRRERKVPAKRATTSLAKPRRRKVRLTAQGRRDLERAKGLSYGLHEQQWQWSLLKGKQSTSTSRAELERARRQQRVRKLNK